MQDFWRLHCEVLGTSEQVRPHLQLEEPGETLRHPAVCGRRFIGGGRGGGEGVA